MSYGLPDDWYIEETGETMVLDQQKVAAEIERLRAALEEYACYGLAKCNAPKLKDGTCIHAGSGHCGDLAFRALEQTVTTEKTS